MTVVTATGASPEAPGMFAGGSDFAAGASSEAPAIAALSATGPQNPPANPPRNRDGGGSSFDPKARLRGDVCNKNFTCISGNFR